MILDQSQQLGKIVSESKDVLILIPQNPSGDCIGAAWAFNFFLKKQNKNVDVVFSGEESLKKFSFLPSPEKVTHELLGTQDFVLSFTTKYNKIIDVKTERLEDELRIYITPEKGSIDPRDFSFIPSRFKYDALFVLGSPDRESLGKVFQDSPDIFYEVPVINIDNHSSNERYGQFNLVDIASSSVCEIVMDFFESLGDDWIDAEISECLLTGIIDATNSFQNKNTTPKSLKLSATLMAKGADQQKIIRHLYKTQPLALLKLWGRVMSRLRWEEESELIWAPVLLEDFVQSRSKPSDITLIIDKIMENYSNGKVFMIVHGENTDTCAVMIKCQSQDTLKKIGIVFDGNVVNGLCQFNYPGSDTQLVGEDIAKKLKGVIS